MKERVLKCPFCPCQFSTHHDLYLHLETFGYDPEQHRAKWEKQKYHRDF